MPKKQDRRNLKVFGLIIILLFFLGIFYIVKFKIEQSYISDEEKIREIAIRKGYDYISSGYLDLGDYSVAFLRVEDNQFERGDSVLGGFQTLYRVYANATSYSFEVEGRKEACSYLMDGEVYREYRNTGNLDSYFNYKNYLKDTEDCS